MACDWWLLANLRAGRRMGYGQLLANLRAGRDMGYGIWAAVGELKGRPGYGIWDMGYEVISMLAGIRTRDLRFRSPAP